ncbi:MAG: hypothetical protein PHO07_21560 [Pirellulales bacterium]|nr:hypothetical protein [Thermoguttaceae bacterium]MDD4789763.1 hypothetical protein [Pirellulales bacterium]MDI9445880.1 hypothetical protein [Planctomycetota bacterium]
MAEIEHHAQIFALDLSGNAEPVIHGLDPVVSMRIQNQDDAVARRLVGHRAEDFHSPIVQRVVRGGAAAEQQRDLDVPPLEHRQQLIETLRIVGRRCRQVDALVDLEQSQGVLVERLQTLLDAAEPEMPGAVETQFGEHFRLLGQSSLPGVVRVVAHGEQSRGRLCLRGTEQRPLERHGDQNGYPGDWQARHFQLLAAPSEYPADTRSPKIRTEIHPQRPCASRQTSPAQSMRLRTESILTKSARLRKSPANRQLRNL